MKWIVEKKVGIFTHYLTLSNKFQPGIEKAELVYFKANGRGYGQGSWRNSTRIERE